MTKTKEGLSCLVATGHLGYSPLHPETFWRGLEQFEPRAVIADSGSCDIGPEPLASGRASSSAEWQKHDIEILLQGARQNGIPLIISSASDTGTNEGVDQYAQIVRELAAEHRLGPLKMGLIKHDMTRDYLRRLLREGVIIRGLDGFPPLKRRDIERTTRFVPVMGVEPIMRCLAEEPDVIITSRTSDCCPFAAFAMHHGYSPDLAYFWGKVLECGSFVAYPKLVNHSVLGTIHEDRISVTAIHDEQRVTPVSLRKHAAYERSSFKGEAVAGGFIHIEGMEAEEVDEKTAAAWGSRFEPSPTYNVKLEGAGYVGHKAEYLVGIRSQSFIQKLDEVISHTRQQVRSFYQDAPYELYFSRYGIDGILGAREPRKRGEIHEVGLMIEVTAARKELAMEIAKLAGRLLLFTPVLSERGSAGRVQLRNEEASYYGKAYEWTMNHIIEFASAEEAAAHFPITFETVRPA
ncbi:MAG: glutamate mutase [Anaerolineales bacterium]|nr:MAG: glutamate mutase [Anaerolineales bacterium]